MTCLAKLIAHSVKTTEEIFTKFHILVNNITDHTLPELQISMFRNQSLSIFHILTSPNIQYLIAQLSAKT